MSCEGPDNELAALGESLMEPGDEVRSPRQEVRLGRVGDEKPWSLRGRPPVVSRKLLDYSLERTRRRSISITSGHGQQGLWQAEGRSSSSAQAAASSGRN